MSGLTDRRPAGAPAADGGATGPDAPGGGGSAHSGGQPGLAPGAAIGGPHFPPEPESVRRDVVLRTAGLLFGHGQTTERTESATAALAVALGLRVTLFPAWGELALRFDGAAGMREELAAVTPSAVDMGKVAAAMTVVDDVVAERIGPNAVAAAIEAVEVLPPVSVLRFAIMAAAGAVALGILFGAAHPLSLVLIGLSAGAGGWLRRWLAERSKNPFIQPFSAALLAGLIGAAVVDLHLSSAQRLVAVCPCMVLVPGPHFLNGMIDLMRARIALGLARIVFATLIVTMICVGLLAGLACGGVALPPAAAAVPVPLVWDVPAAGVAVAAYATFFSMPWRMVPVPAAIGMVAHACRWVTISVAGGSPATGALVACLLVGLITTPVSDRLRLPFAALAFASVVSLIPGVFLFRMAGGLAALIGQGQAATPELLTQTVQDGATAVFIMLAMIFGLILPRMLIAPPPPPSRTPAGG